MDTIEAVRRRLISLCRERRITIHGLARISAVPPTTVRSIVNGESKNPGIVTIKKLCDGMDLPLVEFFDCELFQQLDQEIR